MEKNNIDNVIRRGLSREVLAVVSILSVGFGVMSYFMSPVRSNQTQIDYLKATIDKDKTLNEILTKTQQNDLHTLEGKVTEQNNKIEGLITSVVELKTIINERIPPKK